MGGIHRPPSPWPPTHPRLPPAAPAASFLHIPLFNAERAWAYAMELKKELESSMDKRKRQHLIRRLAKAHRWAVDCAALVGQRCDPGSALEAEAYAAWMHGNLLLEKESDWELALAKYMRAK
jgi:signal recognition particle subunit SRP68